jgi:hypothetical protein
MRSIIICICLIFFIQRGFGQVGIGTTTPHPSARLDVTSTNSGFLPPRMTTLERNAIANPSPGLMIFNTNTQSLEIFTNYGWMGVQNQTSERRPIGGFGGGPTGEDQTFSIYPTDDGGFIIAGTSNSSANGDVTATIHGLAGPQDYWIVKMDASRNIIWNKLLGGNSEEYAQDIQQTSDGGYIVAGYSFSSATGDVTGTNHGNFDFWIVKLDGAGNIIWNKLLGGSGNDLAYSIQQVSVGGYIVAGYSLSSANGDVSGTNHGSDDSWIVRLDNDGNIKWDLLLGGSGSDKAYSIHETTDGGFIVGGISTSSANGNVTDINHGLTDYWIIKLNAGGSIAWNKLLGGSRDDNLQSIQQTSGTEFIVAGFSNSSASGDVTGVNHSGFAGTQDYWILSLDKNGNIIWNKLLGGSGNDFAYSIQQTTDGGSIVAGYSFSSANGDVTNVNHGSSDYWIVKLNEAGDITWNKLIGGSGSDEAHCIHQTADGGYIVAGFSNSSFNGDVTGGNHGSDDIWIIKLGNNGFLF